jgi:ABC-2 type transport system ATP-binding protein
MDNIVSCRNLSKRYGKFMALQNVNLDLPRGCIIGLLGPNGSGKTTFIKLLTGLLQPTMGQILIEGFTPGVETKSFVSYLPERPHLNEGMTVMQQVRFFADFYADFDYERAGTMLNDLHVDPNARFKTLSKGTREKVQLVLVMSRHAHLYVLDEPIGGVDPAARDYILNTIIGNYEPSASVLISTHLIADIEPVLDHVIFLQNGMIRLSESADELRNKSGKSVDMVFREVYRC